jgi:uncharacterized integral membrane protein
MTSMREPPDTETVGSQPEKRHFGAGPVVGVLLLIVALVFIFENTKKVDVRIFVPEVRMPLLVALLIAAILGSLATLLLQLHHRHRRR